MTQVDAVRPIDKLSASAIGAALQSVLSEASRMSGFSEKHLALADLKTLLPSRFEQMELQIRHVIESHSSPERVLNCLLLIDGPSQLRELKDAATSLLNNGAIDLKPGEPLLSASEAHARLKSVVPFLFSAVSGKTSTLTCFTSPAASPMWFASVGYDKGVMECVGYSGEIRRIPLSKLKEAGFSSLQGGEDFAKKTWMEQIHSTLSVSDIKRGTLFVGAHMYPGFCQGSAMERLGELMHKYPERLQNKPKAPVSQPKI